MNGDARDSISHIHLVREETFRPIVICGRFVQLFITRMFFPTDVWSNGCFVQWTFGPADVSSNEMFGPTDVSSKFVFHGETSTLGFF